MSLRKLQNWTLLPEERNSGPDLGDKNKNWKTVKTFTFFEKHVHLFSVDGEVTGAGA